jgi:uncharacterized SAM-binding protein YcdF (DUF218 family)
MNRFEAWGRRFHLPVLVFLIAFLLALGATLSQLRGRELAADWLIDTDTPQKADLIYILGGDYLARAPVAAALFRQGLASRILISREPSARSADFTSTTIAILKQNGVPPDRITDFQPGSGVRSTADEARSLRLYLEAYPASTILVVTHPFHTRRARLALRRAAPASTRFLLIPAAGNCKPGGWQPLADCRHFVAVEWLKLIYYFCTFTG